MRSLEEAFVEAEASMNLEGLHPEHDPHYLDLRSRILDGSMSFTEAKAAILAEAQSASDHKLAAIA